MCGGVLTLNGCGGDDGSAGSAVPFPILDRFNKDGEIG